MKDSCDVCYLSTTGNTWFLKVSIGYCAYFIQPVNQRKVVEFSTTDVFVSEETDFDLDGNFEDSTNSSNQKIGSSCEGELPE